MKVCRNFENLSISQHFALYNILKREEFVLITKDDIYNIHYSYKQIIIM